MALLGTASVEVIPDLSHMKHLTPASGQLGRYSTGVKTAESHSSKLSSTTKRLGSSLAGAAKLAAGAAVAYLGIAQAEKAVQTTQDLTKTTIGLNQNLGIGIKRSSEWGAVLQARGVDSTKAGMAFKTFATQVDSANKGSATSIDLFKELGVSQKDLMKDQGNVQKLLLDTSDGIDKLGAGTARTAAESKLFGRGWATVAPLMRDGSAALKDNLDLTKEYGDTLNKHTLKAQQDLLASQRESKIAWQGLELQFTTAITPALDKVEGQFQRVARIMADPRLSNDQKFHRISHIIETDLSKALDFVVKEIPTVADHVGQEAPKIAEGLVNGFMDANVWGKLALGAFFIHKMGLGGPIVRTLGKRLGLQIGTEVAAGAAGGEAVGAATTAGTALGTAIGSAAAVAAIAIIAKQVSDFLDNLSPTSKQHAFGEPGLPGKQGAPGSSHIGLIPIPGTGGDSSSQMEKLFGSAFGDQSRGRQRAIELEPLTHDFKILGQYIKVLNTEYGSVGSAAKHMSDAQLHGWIDATKAAQKQGAISRGEARKLIATFHDAADESQKSSKRQQDASKDAADSAKKSGQQQQQSAQDTAKKVAAATDQQKSASIKHSAQLAAGVSGNFGAMENVVTAGLDILKGNVNKTLGSFGAKVLNFTLENPGKAGKIAGQAASLLGLQGGGLASVVPGAEVGDKHTLALNGVPIAKVESREGIFVGNRKMMSKLDEMNSRIPRFAKGGQAASPYRFPLKGGFSWGRTDMGVDFGGAPLIGAIGAGQVIKTGAPGWPGGHGVQYRMAAGAPKGYAPSSANIYVNENLRELVGASAKLTAGQAIAKAVGSYPFIEMGWADSAGAPIAAPTYSEGDVTAAGSSFRRFLQDLAGGKGVMGGAGAAAVHKLARILLGGPDGPLKNAGQGALDKSWKAANDFLAKHAPKVSGARGIPGRPSKPIKSLPPSLQRYNRIWPHASIDDIGAWSALPAMPFDKVAELFEWAGLPGITMANALMGRGGASGESSGKPGSLGPASDPGVGIAAITPPFANGLKYPGGTLSGDYQPEMFNPVYSAIVAKQMAPGGPNVGIWHGGAGLSNWNAHYTGPMKQKGGIVLIPEGGTTGKQLARAQAWADSSLLPFKDTLGLKFGHGPASSGGLGDWSPGMLELEARAPRKTLLHELGHDFDYKHLNDTARARMLKLWNIHNWWGPGQREGGEYFADAFSQLARTPVSEIKGHHLSYSTGAGLTTPTKLLEIRKMIESSMQAGGEIPWFGDGGRITADHPTLIGIGDKGRETATLTKGDPPQPKVEVNVYGHGITIEDVEVLIDGQESHDVQMSRMRR